MKRITLLIVLLTTFITSLQAHARDGNTPFEKRQKERMQERRKEKKRKKRIDQVNWSANYQDLLNENGRFFKRLFERFDNGNIIGLELIIASSSWSNVESGFGHTMIRFVDNIGPEADDVVLSFVANVDTIKLNYFKGIFGGYPVFPQVKSLRLFMDEYTNRQKRDLDRYVIISDEGIRKTIINKLKEQWKLVTEHQKADRPIVLKETLNDLRKYSDEEYGQGNYGILPLKSLTGSLYALSTVPKADTKKAEGFKTTIDQIFPIKYHLPESSELGDYTFFANNCAGALVNFLKQVGYPYHKKLGFKGRIPLALPKYLKRALINPYPIVKIYSLRELKEKATKILKLKDISYLRYDINTDQVKKLEEELSLNEFRKLNEVAAFDLDAFRYYASKINETKEISFDKLHGLKKIPQSLYNICTNTQCRDEITADIKNFYGEDALKKMQEEGQEESLKQIRKWETDHRTNRRKRVYTKPYKGLLVNKEIIEHQKNFNLLHEMWN